MKPIEKTSKFIDKTIANEKDKHDSGMVNDLYAWEDFKIEWGKMVKSNELKMKVHSLIYDYETKLKDNPNYNYSLNRVVQDLKNLLGQ